MARSRIFIEDIETRKQLVDDYWYSYLEEKCKRIFRVYKQEKIVFEKEASAGDAFEVIIGIGKNQSIFVTEVTPPRKDWELIAWLLGFSKHERVSTYNEYQELLERKRALCNEPGYVESTLAGPNFEFAEYSLINGKDRQYHNLACWIDEDITKNEICLLIPEFAYPEYYAQKVLFERFGISSEEFENALYTC